jgi:type I restriction enzyme R subunit
VTSQKLERYGKFDSAEDYLDAFERVREGQCGQGRRAERPAPTPEGLAAQAVMEDLRRALIQNGFEPEKLQRAHRARGFKALADVISIVKHAATVQSPLLTAEERVNRAMDGFIAAHKLTAEQIQWLSLVREHLVKNLSMDEEDFDLTPLLEMRGGKAKARKVFGNLAPLITQLNEFVVATS